MSDNFKTLSDIGTTLKKLQNIQLPKIEPLPILQPVDSGVYERMQAQIDQQVKELNESQEAMRRKKEAYDQEVLQTLKNIENNTIGLNEVIPLLSKSVGNQEEILNYLKDSLSISASETKEEAESKWRAVMKQATLVTSDVETIQKLHGFANTILKMFLNS
jgi:DNA repair exonuclease SbcCD ATPase subunit